MTPLEARQVLGLRQDSSRESIDDAYRELYPKYVRKSQYATRPVDRDAATDFAAKLQDAYYTLTGDRMPSPAEAGERDTPASSNIPRVSLGSAPARATGRMMPVRPPIRRGQRTSRPTRRPVSSPCQGRNTPSHARRRLRDHLQGAINAARRHLTEKVTVAVVTLVVCAIGLWPTMARRGVETRATKAGRSMPDNHQTTVPSPRTSAVGPERSPLAATPKDEPEDVSIPAVSIGKVIAVSVLPPDRARHASPSASTTAGKRQLAPRPQPRYGWLVVRSTPWARVMVDSEYVDDSPWLQPKRMACGRRNLTIRANTGDSMRRTVEVAPGEVTVVTCNFVTGQLTSYKARKRE